VKIHEAPRDRKPEPRARSPARALLEEGLEDRVDLVRSETDPLIVDVKAKQGADSLRGDPHLRRGAAILRPVVQEVRYDLRQALGIRVHDEAFLGDLDDEPLLPPPERRADPLD